MRVKEQKRQREGRFHGRLDGEYTVDRIIDERRVGDQVEYLVVWHGFEHEDDHSWEPLDAVCEAEALDVWMAKRPRVDSDEE